MRREGPQDPEGTKDVTGFLGKLATLIKGRYISKLTNRSDSARTRVGMTGDLKRTFSTHQTDCFASVNLLISFA